LNSSLYFLADTNDLHPLCEQQQEPDHLEHQAINWGDTLMSNQDDEDEDEQDDEDDEEHDNFSTEPLPSLPPTNYNRGRRTSVSAESMAPSANQDFVKLVIPKSQAQAERIKVSIGNNFLFRNLDEEQYLDVVNAMSEKRVSKGTTVIEQGDVGDYFYVVEAGTLDCFVGETKVTDYEAGGSFGELALMYNAPRAATIITTSDSVLWALDRITFRTILMENTSRKRRMYETFLSEVVLLKSLESYEQHKIADALESVYFEDGQEVVKQGDIGDQFYIIESGEAIVLKSNNDGIQQQVNQLQRGSYFGGNTLIIIFNI
jgi:CRP-like cAMP-binding protein